MRRTVLLVATYKKTDTVHSKEFVGSKKTMQNTLALGGACNQFYIQSINPKVINEECISDLLYNGVHVIAVNS